MTKLGITPKRRKHGDLTLRQVDVIAAIRAIEQRSGLPPTLDEIGDEMGITRATACYLVQMVRSKGFIAQTEGKYRSIRLTAAASAISVPSLHVPKKGGKK